MSCSVIATLSVRLEHYIHPVVRGVPSLIGEEIASAVYVDTIASRNASGQRVQRGVVRAAAREVVGINTVVAGCRVVGGHIDGVGVDSDWGREVYLLPARRCLIREGGVSQPRARA